ncbi:MAG: hypothetical protein MUF58_13550 [Arcicella sp.]|jgi:hypothetical protein|nr:hypothetical protein [Arcicella sp.]
MNSKPLYKIDTFQDGLYHFFESVSDNVITQKVVAFRQSEEDDLIYSLVFGNVGDNGEIDVYSTNNSNENMETILGTVISTIEIFFKYHPDKIITFTGSTPSRTRLYRAVIGKFVDEKDFSYNIYGISNDREVESFQKHKSYIGYFIQKKDENS